ncbi:putative pectinesterase/pectinesterase inhibitor 22 [Senna tora]|uniref:Putative pectinesterase/pectinesterase inhibitor 22 n=1 Tax=Senna tora TaxID=362788 RepID=A0A834WGL8_9FABA|nr:putative pectinesterase/pectinesterase inhibitor 22 [Senna tora]
MAGPNARVAPSCIIKIRGEEHRARLGGRSRRGITNQSNTNVVLQMLLRRLPRHLMGRIRPSILQRMRSVRHCRFSPPSSRTPSSTPDPSSFFTFTAQSRNGQYEPVGFVFQFCKFTISPKAAAHGISKVSRATLGRPWRRKMRKEEEEPRLKY